MVTGLLSDTANEVVFRGLLHTHVVQRMVCDRYFIDGEGNKFELRCETFVPSFRQPTTRLDELGSNSILTGTTMIT